jgi:effector-binding domain-containing protein
VYERLAHWAADHDRDLHGPPYEIYHSKPGDPISGQHVEVAWPLKPL